MAENKKLVPGKTLSLRLPKNIKPEILDYMNESRDINRNKHLLELLCTKIEDELNPKKDKIVLELPQNIHIDQRKQLQTHLNALIAIITNEYSSEKDSNETEIDFSLFDGLIEEDE